ncbi:MAG: hypothetical protein Q8909_01620 [Bacteroidota bacterium]|nr:hypothetical protein [Bacteroidota bacterium]
MILRILFVLLFLIPIIFQLIWGTKAIKGDVKLKLWQVSVISLIGQILSIIINVNLMSIFITKAGHHDGLPIIGVFAIEGIIGILLLLIILIQALFHYLDRGKETSN